MKQSGPDPTLLQSVSGRDFSCCGMLKAAHELFQEQTRRYLSKARNTEPAHTFSLA